MFRGRYGRFQEKLVRKTAEGTGSKFLTMVIIFHKHSFRITPMPVLDFTLFPILLAEANSKYKPKYYLKKMYATKNYRNKAKGGLSFRSGSSVYVLLRNGNGWCTGKG